MKHILFVCMGNICRSPLAEVEARRAFAEAGFGSRLEVASVGTIGWHQGSPADPRSRALAASEGLDLEPHAARQIAPQDFDRADLIIAMDHRNIADLRQRAPAHAVGRIRLLMEFAGQARVEVPDPYSGDTADFRHSFDLIRQGVAGLTKHLARLHNAGLFDAE